MKFSLERPLSTGQGGDRYEVRLNCVPNGKPGTQTLNSRPEHIKEVADASLQRLEIDSIDLFYPRGSRCAMEEVAGAVRDLIAAGKVTLRTF